jgi:hypothetical protein
MAFVVDDPRANCGSNHWVFTTNVTLGTTNDAAVFDAWTEPGQGLPVYHRDGPMRNIGELGHVYCSVTDGATTNDAYWRNLDLLDPAQGGLLMDRATVRNTNAPTRGLVCIGSSQTNVLHTLFHHMSIGYTNRVTTNRYTLTAPAIRTLVDRLIQGGPYRSFEHMLTIADVPDAFAACAEASGVASPVGDVFREDPLRNVCEMVSFRQNVFTALIAAQVLAGDVPTPVAERRAAAILYRDAYTGRAFVRLFKWLAD